MILTEPADFIDLTEAKAHLNKSTSSTVDDTELQGFISAAQFSIVHRIGQVSLVTAEDDQSPHSTDRGHTIVLDHRPVHEVTTVVKLPGGETVPEADRLSGTDGWFLEGRALRHTRGFPDLVRVTYEAGVDPVPGDYRMAALEMVAHLWRGSQHNRDRPGIGDPDGVVIPGVAYALPYRVRELLGLGKTGNAQPIVA